MKQTRFKSLIINLTLSGLLSLIGNNINGQTLFQHSYDRGFGSELILLSDNNIILTEIVRQSYRCSKMYTSEIYSLRLLKLDTIGGVIWRTNYINSGLSSSLPIYLSESNTGEINVFINSWLCPPISMFYLYKLNDIGSLYETIQLPFTFGTALTPYYFNIDFIGCENQDYLILSENSLIKMNDDGDTLSSYTPLIVTNKKLKSWKQISNTNRLFLCENNELINYSDSANTVVWRKNFEPYDYILDYQITDSGEVLVSGTTKDTIINSNVYSNAVLAKFNFNGDTILYKEFPNSHSIRFLKIKQLNDSVYVAIQSGGDYKLVFLDQNFDYKLIRDLDHLKSFSSLEIYGNSIYILGSTSDSWITSNDQKVLLIKTDVTGQIPELESISNIKQVDQNSVKCYPNPTNGFITIEGALNIENISIYNIHGQLLQRIPNVEKTELSIQLNLPSGLYFMNIEYSNNSRFTSKIQIIK